ncbi:scrapie-responsive protein 1 [Erpetoichthys calabaricus]|uniref:Stimulator of chondrosis 1 n=1 Tax=Erpetoichthys calabaricus TaxID=27687 RepID=A0A8C4T1V2_ERPCA|nr:scrapie-responsive protein 1 [Erpetoichthys calabaricus]
MKASVAFLALLATLVATDAMPTGRPSCYKKVLRERNCHGGHLRPLQPELADHLWQGDACEVICYCNFSELLCCPRDIFFGPKISFVIPCSPP